MTVRRLLPPLLAVIMCTGCLEIKETIRLNQDGSGTAHVMVAFPQLALRFLPGKPIAIWIRPNLPDGVRLTSFKNTQSKRKIAVPGGKKQDLVTEVYDVDVSFDRVSALNDIRVRPDVRNAKAASAGGTPGKRRLDQVAMENDNGPSIGPFQKLTLTEDGELLRFRRVVQAARTSDEIEADAMNRPGSVAKPQAMNLGNSLMVVSITCPGEVIKHNAHKVEDRTLTWTFKLKELLQRQDRDWTIEFTCKRERK